MWSLKYWTLVALSYLMFVSHVYTMVGSDLPVNADEVDVAVGALLDELTQPVQTHAASAIRNCRRAKVHQVLDGLGGLHVFTPCCNRVGDRYASATRSIPTTKLVREGGFKASKRERYRLTCSCRAR